MRHDGRSNLLKIGAGLTAAAALLICLSLGGLAAAEAETPPPALEAAVCDGAAAKLAVERFIADFNGGATQHLDRDVAVDRFGWYTTDAPGQRIDPAARDRNGLMAYFVQRHDQHERLLLRSFRFNGSQDGYGDFEFSLVRSADDGLPPTDYGGKGALSCTKYPPSLAIWSMAKAPPNWPFRLGIAGVLLLLGAGLTILLRRRRAQSAPTNSLMRSAASGTSLIVPLK